MTCTIIIWNYKEDTKLFVIDDGYISQTIQSWLFAAKGIYANIAENNMGLCFMKAATTAPEDILILSEDWQPYVGWLDSFEYDKNIPLEEGLIISNLYQITISA